MPYESPPIRVSLPLSSSMESLDDNAICEVFLQAAPDTAPLHDFNCPRNIVTKLLYKALPYWTHTYLWGWHNGKLKLCKVASENIKYLVRRADGQLQADMWEDL